MDGSGDEADKKSAAGGALARPFDWSRTHLLVVEPERGARNRLLGAFRGVGVGVVKGADSFVDAVENLKEFPVTAAVIELHLPGDANGVQLIRSIRNGIHGRNVNFPIMITVEAVNTHLLFEACRAGIEGALRKPFDTPSLIKRTAAMIREPRRFIGERHYFGPDRRKRSETAYSGPERRKVKGQPTTYYMPAKSGGASLDVMDSPAKTGSSGPLEALGLDDKPDAKAPDAKAPDAKANVDLLEVEAKPVKKAEVVLDPAETKVVAPESPKAKAAAEPVVVAPDPVPAAPKPVEMAEPEAAAKEAVETVEAEEVPEEEVPLTPEEALELHRLWVNTGGREGQKMVLTGADLRGLDLSESDLTGANLENAVLSGVACDRTIFRKSVLSGAKMQKTSAVKGDFAVSRMKHTNFQGAKLDGACFRGADLTGARFCGASLARADFTSARLYGTDFRDCDLRYAIGLNQPQLNRTNSDATTRLPNGLQPRVSTKT
ncbi:MAG: pentapeptide repeat-containing protein [Rhodospirillales bacterium]